MYRTRSFFYFVVGVRGKSKGRQRKEVGSREVMDDG
jgi:hypothetical protein